MRVCRCLLGCCFVLLSVSMLEAKTPEAYFKLTPMNRLKMGSIEKQTLDYSCGAAALAILLNDYFGEKFNESVLLHDIIMRLSPEDMEIRIKEGFSMLDLKELCTRLGYVSAGIQLEHEQVGLLEGPVIILLKKGELHHFVVLQGVTQGRAFIADPVAGHIRMPLFELFEQWDGETFIVGREYFGLPVEHGLVIPKGRSVAPEGDTIRTLRYTPFNQRSGL